MGLLETQHELDSKAIFDEIGDLVTITPSVGAPSTVRAIFLRGETLSGRGESDRGARAFGVLVVKPSAIGGWTPTRSDQVVIGTVTYAVEDFDPPNPDLGYPEVRLGLVAIDD